MSEVTKQELSVKEQIKQAIKAERESILMALMRELAPSASDYKGTIKHTGGLLTQSMTAAFTKGYQTAFKVITKMDKENNEKSVQEKAK
jgi:hypothetical protein